MFLTLDIKIKSNNKIKYNFQIINGNLLLNFRHLLNRIWFTVNYLKKMQASQFLTVNLLLFLLKINLTYESIYSYL